VYRRLSIRLLCLALLTFFTLPAAAQYTRDSAATKKIDEAINEHYLATDFDKAEQVLTGTVTACGDKCSPPVIARAWMYVGIVRGSGKSDQAGAKEAFQKALATDPEAGGDAYVVGSEVSGETWTCHLLSTPCIKGPTVAKTEDFGLVAIQRLPGMQTAYLLRSFDPARGNRSSLQIFRSSRMVARMDMAPPMTVDNFEGLGAVPRPDGGVRFYLISDDNVRATQRTLLLAFDWRPR